MKKSSKLIIGFLALMMSSCGHRDSADNYHIERLFTVDGITVYRFYDKGDYIYFANRAGSMSWNHSERQGKVNYTKHNQVECNGEEVSHNED